MQAVRKTSVQDVMRRLLQPKNIMVSAHARAKEFDKSKYISILNIIQARDSPPHVLPLLTARKLAAASVIDSLGTPQIPPPFLLKQK